MSSKRTGRITYLEPNTLLTEANKKLRGKNGNGIGGQSVYDDAMNDDRILPYAIEDLNISVDLYVMTNDRSNCGNPLSDGNSVIAQYSGRGVSSYMGGTKTNLPEQGGVGGHPENRRFMTTNFTDISLINPIGNTGECVGIESISIEYSNMFTPIVHIEFVDVMGASIFAKEEKGMYDAEKKFKEDGDIDGFLSNRHITGSNLLASLFSYPYPTFVLTIKGYFGDAVSYHLVCSGTDIKFDNRSGNFTISADFAGSLYGALADIPMSFIVSAPYLEYYGRKYWESQTSKDGRFFMIDEPDNKTPMPTFSELETKINGISEGLKKAFESHDEVAEYQKLINARLMIRETKFPMSEVNVGSKILPNVWYCRHSKNIYYYYYIDIEENSARGAAQNSMSLSVYDDLKVFNDSLKSLNSANVGISLPLPLLMLDNEMNKYCTFNGVPYLFEKFYIIRDASGNFTQVKDAKYNKTSGQFDSESDYSISIDRLMELYPGINYFLEKEDFNGAEKYTHLSDSVTKIAVYEIASECDYRAEMVRVKNSINEEIRVRKDKIDSLKNDELINLYGYRPSIENINAIAFAHLDTFMSSFYRCLENIEVKKLGKDRVLHKLGVNPGNTDLPDDFDVEAPLPPFTLFYGNEVVGGKVKPTIMWPKKLDQRLGSLDEVKFVESLLESVAMYQGMTSDFTTGNTTVNGKTRYPGSIYEALENYKNPYSGIISKSDDKLFVDYVIAIFCLRLYYFLSTTYTPDQNAFAFIEAKNFTEIFDKKYAYSVVNFLINAVQNKGAEYYFNRLCGKNLPVKQSDRIYDIGLTNENHGIFTETANGGITYTWHRESVSYQASGNNNITVDYPEEAYTMPIGVFNFNTIASDFEKKEAHKNPKYTTLTNSRITKFPCSDAFLNMEGFRVCAEPCTILNLFKNSNICVSLKDKSKTQTLSEIYFKHINQHNDKKNPLLPKDVFDKESESVISKKTFSDMCQQGAVAGYSDIYVLDKNIINTRISNVYTKNGTYGTNLFFHPVYYNQNEKTRGGISVDAKTINCSKAYLFLFSLRSGHSGFLQNGCGSYNKDGFFSYSELLKEGAFYWRLKYMYDNNDIDPINLDGLSYVHAKKHEVYITESFTKYDKEVGESFGLFLKTNGNNHSYKSFAQNGSESTFSEFVEVLLKTSTSRVNNLIKIFESWSNGKSEISQSPVTFSNIVSYYEITVGGKMYTYSEFNKINGKTISDLDKGPRSLYKITSGSSILVKNGIISNLSYNLPDDKINGSEALLYPEYQMAKQNLLSVLYDVYFVYDSSIHIDTSNSLFTRKNFVACFNKFIDILKDYGYNVLDKEAIEHKNKFLSDDLKLSIYMSLKSIYDRWCCSRQKSYWEYWPLDKSGERKKCISNHFVYMDVYFHKIGRQLIVDMKDVFNTIIAFTPTYEEGANELSDLENATILSYMASIAEKAGCTFYALPQDLSTKGFSDLSRIFKPVSYNNVNYIDDSSTFAIVYKTEFSNGLDNNDGYDNDGYDLADSLGNINPKLPVSLTEGYNESDETMIPAFGVTFGKGNQSYFTDLNFSSSKSSVAQSEFAMRAQLDVASMADAGGRKVNSIGQDIYRMYANYSFQVTISMFGCCQITPLMYFQLNNVPMYHGAYIVTSVKHDIHDGQMTTTFTGTRLSKRGIPIQPGNVMILDSLDWGLEGDETIEEKDDTKWDVSEADFIIEANESKKISKKAFEESKVMIDVYKKSIEQKEAANNLSNSYWGVAAYYFSYSYKKEYDLNCSIDNEEREMYDEAHNLIDFGSYKDDDMSGVSKESLKALIRNNDFIIFNIGQLVGSDIAPKTENIRLKCGDILFYYASEIYQDAIDHSDLTDYDKDEIKKYFKLYSSGCVKICHCTDIESGETKITSYGMSPVTKKSKYIDYFKWDVFLTKKSSCSIGASVV